VYDESVCERLTLIQLARRAGFTIAEIRHLFRGFPADASAGTRWRELLFGKQREIRDRMQELSRMKEILDLLEDCDCPDLDACGAAAADRSGLAND
jgi:MerR family redox-sensitive transcriptional activator SoxR